MPNAETFCHTYIACCSDSGANHRHQNALISTHAKAADPDPNVAHGGLRQGPEPCPRDAAGEIHWNGRRSRQDINGKPHLIYEHLRFTAASLSKPYYTYTILRKLPAAA